MLTSTGVSPSDIEKMTVAADGKVINVLDSPYHGSYPGADKLYLNASQSKIYDNAGIVYFSADLTYAGSLACRCCKAFARTLPRRFTESFVI